MLSIDGFIRGIAILVVHLVPYSFHSIISLSRDKIEIG